MVAVRALHYAGCRKPFTVDAVSRPLTHTVKPFRCQADHTERAPVNRRAVLLATAALGGETIALSLFVLLSGGMKEPSYVGVGQIVAAAEAGNFDNYTSAPSGLKWLDTQEGSGPSPTKGANIRYAYLAM